MMFHRLFRLKAMLFFYLLDPLYRSQHESCSIVRACNGHTSLREPLGKRYLHKGIIFLIGLCMAKILATDSWQCSVWTMCHFCMSKYMRSVIKKNISLFERYVMVPIKMS